MSSWESQSFLDTQTGEIIFLSDPDITGEIEEEEELRQEIDNDIEEKYIEIPTQDSNEGYRGMESFTETVRDKNLQEKLWIALNGKGCFRRFKDVLLNYPEEQECWFEFKEECMKERVFDWLEENELELSEGQ